MGKNPLDSPPSIFSASSWKILAASCPPVHPSLGGPPVAGRCCAPNCCLSCLVSVIRSVCSAARAVARTAARVAAPRRRRRARGGAAATIRYVLVCFLGLRFGVFQLAAFPCASWGCGSVCFLGLRFGVLRGAAIQCVSRAYVSVCFLGLCFGVFLGATIRRAEKLDK